MSASQCERLVRESAKGREGRLQQMSINQRQTQAAESAEERVARLQQMRDMRGRVPECWRHQSAKLLLAHFSGYNTYSISNLPLSLLHDSTFKVKVQSTDF